VVVAAFMKFFRSYRASRCLSSWEETLER
jgi:hypothetical protein